MKKVIVDNSNLSKSILYKFLDKKDRRKELRGVFFHKGDMVASTGFIFLFLKNDYCKDFENKIIDINGTVIEGIYPNYLRVIPKTSDNERIDFDIRLLSEKIKESNLNKKYLKIKKDFLLIKFKNNFFKTSDLILALKAIKELESPIFFIVKSKFSTDILCVKGDNGVFMLMSNDVEYINKSLSKYNIVEC